MPMPPTASSVIGSLKRVRIWYVLLLFICAAVIMRLFYLQIIRHNYFATAARQGQLKEYEIPAQRGVIEAHDGDNVVPVVLNEIKYTLFADPKFVKDTEGTAEAIEKVIGGDANEYEAQIEKGGRYQILAKKLTKDQKEAIDKAVEEEVKDESDERNPKYLWKGIGTREVPYRTYPQGVLASQLLGFVNDEGEGKYGVEQALDNDLSGTPGTIKAITDAQGVPLAANKENVLVDAKAGERVLLTIDLGMQQQAEDLLKKGLDRAQSTSGSLLILEAKTGAVKAMANYPTYNPSEFFKVEDGALFANPVVSAPLEIGSIMKPLTAAAAMDYGVINKDSSYNDPGKYVIDEATVNNIEEDKGRGQRNIQDILRMSLNTGATWILMQMGGGEINSQARERWYEYMTNHYRFGKSTGVEQGYEEVGTVPDPHEGFGLNIQYANTAFGQGMSANMLQVGAAYAAVLNGGTFYQPRMVDKTEQADGTQQKKAPIILAQNIVKSSTATSIKDLMIYVVNSNYRLYGMPKPRPEYNVGGKTGTAQINKPGGGYYEDKFNGTFVGFVGGNDPEYVIVVRVNEPKIPGYAGSKAAAPLFGEVVTMLIDNFGVTPKT